MPDDEVKCSLCSATMAHKKLRGNEFWERPVCRAEIWPYDEQVEKIILQGGTAMTHDEARSLLKKYYRDKEYIICSV